MAACPPHICRHLRWAAICSYRIADLDTVYVCNTPAGNNGERQMQSDIRVSALSAQIIHNRIAFADELASCKKQVLLFSDFYAILKSFFI